MHNICQLNLFTMIVFKTFDISQLFSEHTEHTNGLIEVHQSPLKQIKTKRVNCSFTWRFSRYFENISKKSQVFPILIVLLGTLAIQSKMATLRFRRGNSNGLRLRVLNEALKFSIILEDNLQLLLVFSTIEQEMAKKIKNNKLTANKPTQKTSNKSAFYQHSEKVQKAKQKRIQKINETKDRVMNKKKQNRMLSIPNSRLAKSNKVNKFALIEDNDQGYEPSHTLTHKGTNLSDIKHFNDMNFDNDQQYDEVSNNFDDLHAQAHFHGFEQQNEGNADPDRKKSKNQIYKQIIKKSKDHKRQRQEQYEQNFNAAVQLDQKFQDFVSKLKFRNNDAKVREKIQNRDLEYERLMNELKEDERVVANRVVDNNRKGAEKIRKKKNQQLNELMKNSDNQSEEDIRGWVKGIDSDQEQSGSGSGSGSLQQQQEDDEIDEVDLSSQEQEADENEQDQQSQEDGGEQQAESEESSQNVSYSEEQNKNSSKKNNKKKIVIKSESSEVEQNQIEVKKNKIKNSKNIISKNRGSMANRKKQQIGRKIINSKINKISR